jgi:hypothetical protein
VYRLALLAALSFVFVGCGQSPESAAENSDAPEEQASADVQYTAEAADDSWQLEEGRDYVIDDTYTQELGPVVYHHYDVTATHAGESDPIAWDLLEDHPDQDAIAVNLHTESEGYLSTGHYYQTPEIRNEYESEDSQMRAAQEAQDNLCADMTPQDYEEFDVTPKEMGCNPDGSGRPVEELVGE